MEGKRQPLRLPAAAPVLSGAMAVAVIALSAMRLASGGESRFFATGDPQLYLLVARDLFGTGRAFATFGSSSQVPYRYGRMGLPLLAWLFAFGRPAFVGWTMIGINLVAVAAIPGLAVLLLDQYDAPPGAAALILVLPAYGVMFGNVFSDPLAIALILVAYLLDARRHETAALAVLAYAVLVKEIAALALVPLLWRAWRTRDRGRAVAIVSALVPYALWCCWLRWRVGAFPFLARTRERRDALGLPFSGLRHTLAHPGADGTTLLVFVAATIVLGAAGAWLGRRTIIGGLAAVFTAMTVCLGNEAMRLFGEGLRVLLVPQVFGLLALAIGLRSRRAPAPGRVRPAGDPPRRPDRDNEGMVVRPEPGSIPDAPGSYQFLDAEGRVIYVGKAKSLRSRLSNYFAPPETLLDRTAQMVQTAERVEWIVAKNEVEAFFLEFNLIKRHRPRFNVRLKDDKSYPYLAVTLDEEWPRAMVMRGQHRKGVRYFGPYAHAYAIRETLDLLLRTFPIRTCTNPKFDRHHRLGRPCLYAHIEKCAAPCVGDIGREEYDRLVGELLDFLDGEHDAVLRRLDERMRDASDQQEFELAARVRDQLASVRKAIERQQMVGSREEDYDLIGLAEDELEASIQVFYVRKGRVVGRKGLIVDKVEDLETPALVARVVEQLYADAARDDVPREILVPEEPDDLALYEELLALNRGAKVRIRVPRRGGKRELLATATLNARESFQRHKLRRASDHNARARALLALQDALELPEAPLRIECFDISHIQGTEIVASMVVMEDGIAKRSDYRRFKVKSLDQQDDFASMEEVLTRRFRNYLRERDEGAHAGKRFAYPPNLLLVDGGRGQLNVAVRVLEELGLEDICVASLAKRFEEVYLPHRGEPVRIPRDSEALYLLQQVRDEAHRFAITYHRQLRAKKMTKSVIDDVPGLGPGRRQRLLKEVGSVKRLRELTEQELTAITWLPDAVGAALYRRLHGLDAPERAARVRPGATMEGE